MKSVLRNSFSLALMLALLLPTWGAFAAPAAPFVNASALQRQVDGDGDGQAVCDIGAYEYHRTLFIAFTHQ